MSEFDELDFLRSAIQIDSSESPEEMREYLVRTLETAGFTPTVDKFGNTITTRGSTKDGPHLVLNTHIDTVSPHVKFGEQGGKLKGRGSCDAKGPLAVLLKSFIECDINGKLTLAVTPDEETELQGSKNLDLDADAVIVGEPTDLDPCVAARGWCRADITFKGKNVHASEPEKGISSIVAASKAILALQEFDTRFKYNNQMLPDPDLTASIIEGGNAENQVPYKTVVTVDRRLVPPETPASFSNKLEDYLHENLETKSDISVTTPSNTEPLDSFETSQNTDIVQHIVSESGNEPRIFEAATEASRFKDTDVVVFGPGILEGIAHSDNEYIKKERVIQGSTICKNVVEKYL